MKLYSYSTKEAYFVGWKVVQSLLEKGILFKDISSVKEDEMPKYVNHAIVTLNA